MTNLCVLYQIDSRQEVLASSDDLARFVPALAANGVKTADELDSCSDEFLLSAKVGMTQPQVAKVRGALARAAAKRKSKLSPADDAEASPSSSAAAATAEVAQQAPAQLRDGVLAGPLEVKEPGLFVDKWTPAACSFDVSTKTFKATPSAGGAPLLEKKVSKV